MVALRVKNSLVCSVCLSDILISRVRQFLIGRMLANTLAMAHVLAAQAGAVGMQSAVAITLVKLALNFERGTCRA